VSTCLLNPHQNNLLHATRQVRAWVREAFGPVLAAPEAPRERGLRFVEEAIELAQALGVTAQEVAALTQRVYEKPADSVAKEVPQVFICLLAVVGAYGQDLVALVNNEWARIQNLGPAHFTERMRRKIELGFSGEKVSRDGVPSGPLPGYVKCPSCDGRGEVGVGTRDCGECRGTGYVALPLPGDQVKEPEAPGAGPLGTIEKAVGGSGKPFEFTFGPGVLYGHESDETVWEQARAAAHSLTNNIRQLQQRGYQVELYVTAPGAAPSRTIALYGADPTPGGQIAVITDPSNVVMQSAYKTITTGFTNDA
jgi:hypothetical protein